MIERFEADLRNALAQGLPGSDAHRRMIPANRPTTAEYLQQSGVNPRQSAVLILFYPENDGIHTVFIKRHDYEGVHSGQIAFPGGKFEEEDRVLQRTALREAGEEVAIDPGAVRVIGQLSEVYIPPSNFLVTPFLAVADKQPVFVPDPREVAFILRPEIGELLDDLIIGREKFTTSAGYIEAPFYAVGDYKIWGATAAIVSELKEVLQRFV